MIGALGSRLLGNSPVSFFCLALVLAGCGAPAGDRAVTKAPVLTASSLASSSGVDSELTVFAAASLTGPFEELGLTFEQANPGVKVVMNFGGSQTLVQQIISGAPADVFASANTTQMDALVSAGLVETGSAEVFSRNQLVVVIPADNPGSIAVLEDLTQPGKKIVLAAKEVPAGQYTVQFLERAALDPGFGPTYRDGFLANVVSYEENVKSVLQKVILGEADAGIVYVSDAAGAPELVPVNIPVALNVLASYPIAALKDSSNLDLAQAFVDLVLSPEGQQVLVKSGFLSGKP